MPIVVPHLRPGNTKPLFPQSPLLRIVSTALVYTDFLELVYSGKIMTIFRKHSLKVSDKSRTKAAELTLKESIYPLCLVTILFFLWVPFFSKSLIKPAVADSYHLGLFLWPFGHVKQAFPEYFGHHQG